MEEMKLVKEGQWVGESTSRWMSANVEQNKSFFLFSSSNARGDRDRELGRDAEQEGTRIVTVHFLHNELG